MARIIGLAEWAVARDRDRRLGRCLTETIEQAVAALDDLDDIDPGDRLVLAHMALSEALLLVRPRYIRAVR